MRAVFASAVLLAPGFVLAQNSSLLIDDFSSGAFDTGYLSNGSVSQWVNASSALGGQRFVGLNIADNPLDNSAKARVRNSTQNDFSVILEPGVDATSTLQYGNAGLGADLKGYKDISLDFRTSDRDLQVKLTLFGTNNATLASWTQNYTAVDTAGVLKFGLGDTSSFGKVERIAFDFTPRTGGDFALKRISASPVPEPSAIAAISVGAIALLRRRKKA